MGLPTLFLAAGHGGRDTGAVFRDRIERDLMIRFIKGVRDWTRFNDIPTGRAGGIVFPDDQLDLAGLLGDLRAWKPDANDLVVEFHLNQNTGNDAAGGAMAIADTSAPAQRVAKAWLLRWCKATGINNHGVHESTSFARRARDWDDFGLTRPAFGGLILELGCLACDKDIAAVGNPVFQSLCAEALWDLYRKRD